jgi:hypothetical protein|tara:strand:+ start:105 stop:464 length:360 start_codon:yes stop_codon:yes gene_type:complete
MSHEYTSVMYCTQKLREFLDEKMLKKHGHKFPNIKNHKDHISFKYLNEEFAVKLEIMNGACKKAKAFLEIKTESLWKDLKFTKFDIKRNKNGKISNKTYESLFDDFIISGLKEYASSKQ